MDMFQRDPEEVGPEHPDDLNHRMDLIESVHTYEGNSGRCTVPTRKFCYEHKVIDYHNECGLPEYSVLHYDDFADRHDHGGGDCMCFEGREYE